MLTMTNLLLGMMVAGMWVAAACSARFTCSAMRLPKPGFAPALLLTLLAAGGAIACQFAVGTMMGMAVASAAVQTEVSEQVRTMLVMPVWMLVCAMIYRVMLPTTFGKAMTVFFGQAIVATAIMVAVSLLANATQQPNLVELRSMLPF